MLSVIWAWVLPYVGPWLPAILRNIPGWETIKRACRRVFIALLIIAGVASLYVLMKSMRNPVQEFVSAAEVKASLEAERNAQLTSANAQLQRTLEAREAEKAKLEAEKRSLESELEEARAKSPDPDTVVFPADDPWLLAKRRRR